MASRPITAEQLVETDAERASLAALRDATGTSNGAMERHCVRVFLIALDLAQDRQRSLDREVVLCAALLHDIGLYPMASSHDHAYVTDGRRLAETLLEPFRWPPGRVALTLDAIERHHALTPQWKAGAEVECLRLADLVDVSGGLVRHGLRGGRLRGLFAAVPRRGLYAHLLAEVTQMGVTRPRTLPGVFVPPGA